MQPSTYTLPVHLHYLLHNPKQLQKALQNTPNSVTGFENSGLDFGYSDVLIPDLITPSLGPHFVVY